MHYIAVAELAITLVFGYTWPDRCRKRRMVRSHVSGNFSNKSLYTWCRVYYRMATDSGSSTKVKFESVFAGGISSESVCWGVHIHLWFESTRCWPGGEEVNFCVWQKVSVFPENYRLLPLYWNYDSDHRTFFRIMSRSLVERLGQKFFGRRTSAVEFAQTNRGTRVQGKEL